MVTISNVKAFITCGRLSVILPQAPETRTNTSLICVDPQAGRMPSVYQSYVGEEYRIMDIVQVGVNGGVEVAVVLDVINVTVDVVTSSSRPDGREMPVFVAFYHLLFPRWTKISSDCHDSLANHGDGTSRTSADTTRQNRCCCSPSDVRRRADRYRSRARCSVLFQSITAPWKH
jgi:hypothetical protein